MGNSPSTIVYNVPSSNVEVAGETLAYRHPKSQGLDLFKAYGGRTIHEGYRERFDRFPDVDGFGRRVFDSASKTYTQQVQWITNRQFREEAEALGSGLLNLKLCPTVNEWRNMSLRFAGLYAKNSLEYLLFDVACTMYDITVVPIYDTLGEEATAFAFNQTRMETCAMTVNHIAPILKLKQSDAFSALRNIIIMDPANLTPELEDQSLVNGIKLIRWGELAAAGRQNPRPWAVVTPDSIYAFSYTSGTTGEPKGAMLSHQNITSAFLAFRDVVEPRVDDAYLNYLPMAHVMERLIINACIWLNVKIGVFSGDVLKLKEDLAVFRPTLFVSVPRLFNRFYDAILTGLKEKSGLAKALFKRGIQAKIGRLQTSCAYDHWLYDRLIFNKLKAVLGGRVRLMVTGSAPIQPDTLDFLKAAFCSILLEGYGQTEGTALEVITLANDPLAGHVGGPALTNEIKLVDVPELNYTSRDRDAQGNPTPRGEIWVRGPNVVPGYYKMDQRNAETFTPDGWLKSGDIGMLFSEQRRLKIIDRKKNIFKLAQGEYIAPEKLENIYRLAHPAISTVYVYGDSLKSAVIGVVNIERAALVKFAAEFGIAGDDPDRLARDPAVKKKVLELFDGLAKAKKLNSLEKLKDVHIETRVFGELGLLTEAFKVKRVETKNFYQSTFDEMYKNIA